MRGIINIFKKKCNFVKDSKIKQLNIANSINEQLIMEEINFFIQNEIMNLAFVKVGFDESLIKSKLLDSITVVDLLVSIEEKTGKKIPQYMINEDNFDTINIIQETLKKI